MFTVAINVMFLAILFHIVVFSKIDFTPIIISHHSPFSTEAIMVSNILVHSWSVKKIRPWIDEVCLALGR